MSYPIELLFFHQLIQLHSHYFQLFCSTLSIVTIVWIVKNLPHQLMQQLDFITYKYYVLYVYEYLTNVIFCILLTFIHLYVEYLQPWPMQYNIMAIQCQHCLELDLLLAYSVFTTCPFSSHGSGLGWAAFLSLFCKEEFSVPQF